MRLGVLFSGGKDSTYSAWLVKKQGHEIACLISLFSENKDSYMFHTPNIDKVKSQSVSMNIPLLIKSTKGIKEEELKDLESIIKQAKSKFQIEGIVTGALHSVYQASRIQKICGKLGLECLNPLWHKDEINYLSELIDAGFEVIITGVSAYPLDKSWLGRKIDKKFIEDAIILKEKYKIHPAGEGGEFETFVLNCPLFKNPLKVTDKKISGEENYWRLEIEVK